jgi:hypothetical protein
MEQELQEQIAGAGANPAYISSIGEMISEIEVSDTAQISGPPLNSVGVNAALLSGTTGFIDAEQYIENSDEYRDEVEGGGRGGGGGVEETRSSGRTSGASGNGTMDAIGAASGLDQDVTQDVLGFNDEDYMIYNEETGYWEPDVEALEQWEKRILARANVLAALLIAISSKMDARKIAEETFSGVPIEEAKHSYKEAFARKIGFLQKIASTAVNKLFEQINTRNRKIYEEKMNEIKSRNSGSGAATVNFLTGGSKDIETTEAALRETARYLETTNRTLKAMQKVIRMMMEFLKETMGSDDFSTLGIINQLSKFDARIDEMSRKVDEKLQKTLDDLDSLPDSSTQGWAGFVMAIFGGIIGFAIEAIVANCSDIYSFADDLEYMDDVDMENIIDQYRGSMTTMQNAYRAFLSLKLFQTDLRNTARQEFTGLSGISGNAEILMQSAEATLGHTLQIFDATASQLMMKTQLHNRAVKFAKDLQQLKKAQPLRLLSLCLSVIMLALSIVVTCLTGGGGIVLVLGAIIAIAAIAKALVDAFATDIATDVPSYSPPAPEYDPTAEPGESGDRNMDALNNVENAQGRNMSNSCRSNTAIGEASDGYYYFDSQSFSTYELKQNVFDNVIRSIFSLIKNARDMRRVARAEFTGRSTADSGGALLQNAVENVILQKQLILSAIKFQHQEVISAKNIDKQREIGKDKAWEGFGWNLFGSLAGALLGGMLGGAPGALLGMSIGSSLGSSIFQLKEVYGNQHWKMDINNQGRNELDNLLRARGDESTEGRLDRAEAEAFQHLLDAGLVGTGDGYFGVNFGLVSEVYAKLGRIAAAKEALAKMRAMKAQLRSIVKQEFTGISLGNPGDLVQTVNQATFSTVMRVAGNLVKFLQSKAEILNRARDAEKARDMALGLFIVNAAVSVAGFTCMGVTNAIANALAGLAPGVMSFASALASLIQAGMSANSDLGYYQNYDAKTAVDKTGRRVNNARSVDERLDQLEYEMMLEMNSDMVQSLSSSYSTVSPFVSKLNARMKGLYNVREALATARSILSAARNEAKAAFTGKRLEEATFGKDTIDNYRQVSLSILDSLKQALDVQCERYNQMSEATKQAILAAVQTAISAASLCISIVSSLDEGKIAEMDRDGVNGSPEVSYGDTETVPEGETPETQPQPGTAPTASLGTVEITTTPAAEFQATAAAGAEVTQSSTTQDQAGTIQAETAPVDSSGTSHESMHEVSREKMVRDELEAERRMLSKVAGALRLANSVLTIVAEVSYDWSPEHEKSAKEPEKGKAAEVQKSSSNAKKDIFTSMSDMDADIDASEFQLSVFQNHSEALAIAAQRFERLTNELWSTLAEVPNTVKTMIQRVDIDPVYGEVDTADASAPAEAETEGVALPASISVERLMNLPAERVAERIAGFQPDQVHAAIEQLEQMETEKAQQVLTLLSEKLDDPELQQLASQAAASMQVPQPIDAPESFTPSETERTSPSTRALLDYADRIEQQAADKAQQVQEQLLDPAEIEALEVEIQKAEAINREASVPDTIQDPQELLDRLIAQRDSTVAEKDGAVHQLQHLQAKLQATEQEVVALSANIDQQVEEIKTAQTAIGEQIDALEALENRSPEQEAQLQSLQSELQLLQAERGELEAAKGLLGERVSEVQAQIADIKTKIQQLNQEIKTLNQDINNVRRLVEQQETETTQASNVSNSGGFALALGFVRDMLGLGSRRVKEDLENVDGIESQPGAVQAGKDDILVAVASAQGGKSGLSYRDQYERALEEEELYMRHTSGAGVA